MVETSENISHICYVPMPPPHYRELNAALCIYHIYCFAKLHRNMIVNFPGQTLYNTCREGSEVFLQEGWNQLQLAPSELQNRLSLLVYKAVDGSAPSADSFSCVYNCHQLLQALHSLIPLTSTASLLMHAGHTAGPMGFKGLMDHRL